MASIRLRSRRFCDKAIKDFRYGLLTDSDVIRICRFSDDERGIGSLILKIIGLLGGIAIAYQTPRGKEVFESLIGIAKKIISAPKKAKELFSKLKLLEKLGVPSDAVNKIKSIVSELWEKIKEKLSGAAAGVKSRFSRIKLSFRFKRILSDLKSLRKFIKRAGIDNVSPKASEMLSRSIIALYISRKKPDAIHDAKKFVWKMYWEISRASKKIKNGSDDEAKKFASAAQKRANEITISMDKYMANLKKDSVPHRDSRLKRSLKRPGRATSWEIKMVLGYPENASVDTKRYIGRVDQYGNVAVVDLMNPKKQPAMLSSMELDRIAMTGKRESYGFGSTGGGYTGGSKSSEKEENKNQSTLGKVLGKVGGIVNTAGDVATTIRTIKNGSHMTVMAAREIGNMAGELGSLAKSIVGTIKRAIK